MLVLRHTNFEATMTRIAAMLSHRARRVPNPAVRGFAPDADFVMVAMEDWLDYRYPRVS
jgi:hypothetical protein